MECCQYKNWRNRAGTWKADGPTLSVTGVPTKTLQWHLSEDGKRLTTQAPNKPEQVWDRD